MFKQFLDFMKAFANSIEHLFLDFIHQAIPVAKQAILNDVLPVAEEIVTELMGGQLSGGEKRAAAFAKISASLQAAAKEVEPSLINLAIELAYQKVQTLAAPVPEGNGGNFAGGADQAAGPAAESTDV